MRQELEAAQAALAATFRKRVPSFSTPGVADWLNIAVYLLGQKSADVQQLAKSLDLVLHKDGLDAWLDIPADCRLEGLAQVRWMDNAETLSSPRPPTPT